MKHACVAIPHEVNAPIVSPLVWWLLQLPAWFDPGRLTVDTIPSGDYKVSSARGAITRRFLKSKCHWLWMIDSDMLPWTLGLEPHPSGVPTVIEAMERDDVDILTGFFLRMGAGGPVPSLSSSLGRDHVLEDVFGRPPGLHHVPELRAGGACLCVKRHVFEKFLEEKIPWFRDEWDTSGDPEKHNSLLTSEDTWFFHYANEMGFKTWIDTRLCWGHIKPTDMRDELIRSRDLIAATRAEALLV